MHAAIITVYHWLLAQCGLASESQKDEISLTGTQRADNHYAATKNHKTLNHSKPGRFSFIFYESLQLPDPGMTNGPVRKGQCMINLMSDQDYFRAKSLNNLAFVNLKGKLLISLAHATKSACLTSLVPQIVWHLSRRHAVLGTKLIRHFPSSYQVLRINPPRIETVHHTWRMIELYIVLSEYIILEPS